VSRVTALGILDVSPTLPAGSRAAISGTISLCEAAGHAGYTRYWLAQHYAPGAAHSSPDVLCGILAGLPTRLRIGAAGMLLRYDCPLRIAGAFRLLETLFPGRIDLGVARGTTDPVTARALGVEREPDAQAFAQRFADLCRFARSEVLEEGAPVVQPQGPVAPQIWALGSAHTSAELAAVHGTAFCQALFISQKPDPAVLRRYRDEFRPSKAAGSTTPLSTPLVSLAVAGVCDDDEPRARQAVRDYGEQPLEATVVGTGEQCADQIHELAHLFDVQEVVFLDVRADVEDRRRSHQVLAAAVLGSRGVSRGSGPMGPPGAIGSRPPAG
jgi:luciferase family oxidoreductase group 1